MAVSSLNGEKLTIKGTFLKAFLKEAVSATVYDGFAEKMRKGDRVVVIGQMKTRKWTDKDGNDRYSTELHAGDFFGVVAKAPAIKKADPGSELDDDDCNQDLELEDEIPF